MEPGPSRAGGRRPGNLPLELSSFVGREREIAEIGRLLTGGTRLLTLTGPGGCGKTRLALEAARGLAQGFDDGAWLVELASLSDPDLVPQAVAGALGVREQPGRPLAEGLSDFLGQRNLLLVLDNCEHLVDACAGLTEALLRACPGLRVLATSREPLGITGEVALTVPPLSLPDPRRLPTAESLPQYEAARLFVERAVAVKPSFELTERNAVAVARVCYRLDGMPLAIELAAARAKVLTVEQISSRLESSFGLLTAGSRTGLPRHRTLRATIDWSYVLLPEQERSLLRRLSVFAGGCSLEAAEMVCAGEGIERDDVLDLLAHLVDKSLVLVAEDGGEARYRLLETVRQYAAEKLEESGEAERVRERHAAFFLGLAEAASSMMRGPEQGWWLDRLERENGNLRAAMSRALERDDVLNAVRFCWSLHTLWWARGRQDEGRRWAESVLAKGDGLPPAARARALFVAGVMLLRVDAPERSAALCEESLALFRQVGEGANAAHAALVAGAGTLRAGEPARGNRLVEESVRLARAVGDAWIEAQASAILGAAPFARGDYERAAGYFERGLALARRFGDPGGSFSPTYYLAMAVQALGDHRRAMRLYVEALRLAQQTKDTANVGYCLWGLAECSVARGDPERAARLYGAAEASFESVGMRFHAFATGPEFHDRYLTLARDRLDEASWEAARTEGRAMSSPEQAVEYALEPLETPQSGAREAYPAGLSEREAQVLRLVAKGMTNARIAEELFISPRTVHRHLGSIYSKIGTSSRAAATRFALEHNLV